MISRQICGFVLSLIIVLGFIGATHAGQKRTVLSQFRFRTHLGTQGRYELRIGYESASLDGLAVSEADILANQGLIRRILAAIPSVQVMQCSDGNYSHRLKISGRKEVIEEGCLSDARFYQLFDAYAELSLKTTGRR